MGCLCKLRLSWGKMNSMCVRRTSSILRRRSKYFCLWGKSERLTGVLLRVEYSFGEQDFCREAMDRKSASGSSREGDMLG